MGVAALLLASPLLLAFAHFLAEGHVGDHQDGGFRGAVLDPGGMVMYLLPYLYGPISFSTIPAIARFWGNGGYLGLIPFTLAIGGMLTAWRQPVTWLLGLWIIFALGVGQGAPILLDLFQYVPLVSIAAFARYMNTGWLFCAVILAAMFIDRIPAFRPAQWRRFGSAALIVSLLMLTATLVLTGAPLRLAWQPHGGQRGYIVASAAAVAGLIAGLSAAIWWRAGPRAQSLVIALATIEAITLFAIPFASSPAATKLDLDLVAFLQDPSGFSAHRHRRRNRHNPQFRLRFRHRHHQLRRPPHPHADGGFRQA